MKTINSLTTRSLSNSRKLSSPQAGFRSLLREVALYTTLIAMVAGLYTLCVQPVHEGGRTNPGWSPATPVAPVERQPIAHDQESLIASL